MKYNEEKIVGERAERMLESALLSKIGGAFKSHYKGKRDKKNIPLAKSTSSAGVKDWQGTQGDTISFLNKVVVKMAKHGFVQHYGVDNTLRRSGERTREIPKKTTYGFKAHRMNMKATPFLKTAVDESGIVPYVSKEIARIRGKQVLVSTGKFLDITNID